MQKDDAAREQQLETTVLSWTAQNLDENSDALTSAIEAKVVAIQTAAIADHESGGDTTAAQRQLQALVEMMVYSKILVRKMRGG